MIGANAENKARLACVEALKPFVTRHRSDFPWPTHFWADAYVIGFVVGLTTMMTKLSPDQLTAVEQSRAVLSALDDVGCNSSGFADCANRLMAEGNGDYTLGMANAGTVAEYVMNIRPMDDDPDVIAAIQILREVAPEKRMQHSDVGGALMYMLFHAIVEMRLNVGEWH